MTLNFEAIKMKEDNPMCFDESRVGEVGVSVSEDSLVSGKSWIVDSRTSYIKQSDVGDNIFYLDDTLILEEGSEFNGSLFSRRRGAASLRLSHTKINANVNLLDQCFLSFTNSNIEGNLIVRGEHCRLNCLNVNIFGNVIINLPKYSSIDLVDVEINGDLILDSESYLRMDNCSIFGYNTIVKKGGGELRMDKCHFNNSGYNEYNLTEDTEWKEKIERSKHM